MRIPCLILSSNRIRGTLGSIFLISYNCGILISFMLGAYFSYVIIPLVFFPLPILFVINFCTLPDTPQSYLERGFVQEAQESLHYYRQPTNDRAAQQKFQNDFEQMKMMMRQETQTDVRLSDFCKICLLNRKRVQITSS